MLKLEPANEHWHYLLSVALLSQGKLKEGLYEGEWRLEKYGSWPRATGLPLWEGQSDARLFVSYEQGVADELQWLPILSDLRRMGLSVLVEADARILPIIRRTFGCDFDYTAAPKSRDRSLVFSGHWVTHDYGCTHILPVGSLPFHFRREGNFEDFQPLRAKEFEMPERFSEDSFNVGLAWRSRASREGLYTRLGQWRELFDLPNVTIWNLQYDEEQLDILEAGVDIKQVSGLDTFDGLDDLGGFMSLLDLVISPTNAVSKLAGALGIPCSMLLHSDDHMRYGCVNGYGFPLLPSVRTYVKTAYDDDWNKLIAAVVEDVRVKSEARHKTD